MSPAPDYRLSLSRHEGVLKACFRLCWVTWLSTLAGGALAWAQSAWLWLPVCLLAFVTGSLQEHYWRLREDFQIRKSLQ